MWDSSLRYDTGKGLSSNIEKWDFINVCKEYYKALEQENDHIWAVQVEYHLGPVIFQIEKLW